MKVPARQDAPTLGRSKPGTPKPGAAKGGSSGVRPKSGPSLRTQGVKVASHGPRTKIPNNRAGARSRKGAKPAPVILMVAGAVAVVLALLLLPRAYQPGPQATAQARRPAASIPTAVAQTVRRSAAPAGPAMNLTPAAQITLDQIASFEGGTPPSLRFTDGSSLRLDPITMDQLRPEVRLRLTYNRSDHAR